MFRQSLRCQVSKPPQPGQHALIVTPKSLQIRLHVKPNSQVQNMVQVGHDRHVAVKGLAREGEANRGVITLMSDVLGLKSDAVILVGHKSRDKVILFYSEVQNGEVARMLEKLKQAASKPGSSADPY